MLTILARNRALNAISAAYGFIAAHTDWPGRLGANNEVSGGSPAYARKAHTWNSAATAALDDSNAPVIDIPTTTTVKWLSIWTAATAGECGAVIPAGGSAKRYTVVLATDVFTSVAHGFIDTNQIVFWGDTVPTGLTEGTIYFVRDATTDTFKVAATSGGVAIDITGAGSEFTNVSKMVPEVFASQGTYTLTDTDIGIDVTV
jgi:hypothetical protein